jgi:hypothetical protein
MKNMNKPHIDKLFYKIITKDNVDYVNAPAVSLENETFKMVTSNNEVTFEMKKHFSSEQDAKIATDEFLNKWEIIIGLENAPDDIRFKFDRSEVVHFEPNQNESNVNLSVSSVGNFEDDATNHVSHHKYPDPPDQFSISPDVETMYLRYKAYCEGRDTLLSMAYLLLTVAESKSATQKEARKEAAAKLRVEEIIFDTLGRLCSTKGNESEARKAPRNGVFLPLKDNEREWVLAACKLLIKRCGEFEFCGTENLSLLKMDSLPSLN